MASITGAANMKGQSSSPTSSRETCSLQSVHHQSVSHQTNQPNKIYSSNCNNLVMLENSRNPRNSSGPLQNSVTLLPFSNKAKSLEKSVKIIPKITVNNLSRTQRLKPESPTKNFLNDDLGNILDIPIIFAKDGESINSIEKAPPLPQVSITSVPENSFPQKNPRLGPTKVVLISNKQDKSQPAGKFINPQRQAILRQNLTNQNLNHVLLQPRTQNPVITSRPSLPVQNSARAAQSTVKYTKIILAKRNSLPGANYKDKGEPVILTKTNQKISTPRIFSTEKNEHRYSQVIPKILEGFDDELLEIEDAIKTNIIERKVDLPATDSALPKEKVHENGIMKEETKSNFDYSESHLMENKQ